MSRIYHHILRVSIAIPILLFFFWFNDPDNFNSTKIILLIAAVSIGGFLGWYYERYGRRGNRDGIKGVLPTKEIRYETAIEFMRKYSEYCKAAYPEESEFEVIEIISGIIDEMSHRSIPYNPNKPQGSAMPIEIYVKHATEVADELRGEKRRSLSRKLVLFVRDHNLWYANY